MKIIMPCDGFSVFNTCKHMSAANSILLFNCCWPNIDIYGHNLEQRRIEKKSCKDKGKKEIYFETRINCSDTSKMYLKSMCDRDLKLWYIEVCSPTLSENSVPLVQMIAIGHNPDPVPINSHPHTYSLILTSSSRSWMRLLYTKSFAQNSMCIRLYKK
jgi:hypothetical protein